MKKIIILVLSSICIMFPVNADKSSFDVSIFWQLPVADSRVQYMFSNQDPAKLESVFNDKGFSTSTGNPVYVNNAITQPHFTQYLTGSYFGCSLPVLYMTGKTVVPKQKKPNPPVGINMFTTRLAAINLITASNPTFVDIAIKDHGINALFRLTPIVYWLWNQHGQFIYNNQKYGDAFMNNPGNVYALDYVIIDSKYEKTWEKYNPKNWEGIQIIQKTEFLISQVFLSSCITQKTNINQQSFVPISGLNMQAGSYFDQDEIVFALHLTTPARLTDLNEKTTLQDVMNQQNTYADMYPKKGYSECGDTFGF